MSIPDVALVGGKKSPREWQRTHTAVDPINIRIPSLNWDRSLIATDASCSMKDTIGAWAAVRGDGQAILGWYTAPRTSTTSAELEAMKRAMIIAVDGPLTLITDSIHAARTIEHLRAGGDANGTFSSVLHRQTLNRLAKLLQERSIEVIVERGPDGTRKRSPAGLGGIADRLAWTALQLAVKEVDPTHPAVGRWLRSRFIRDGSRRDRLRDAFNHPGRPGSLGRLDMVP